MHLKLYTRLRARLIANVYTFIGLIGHCFCSRVYLFRYLLLTIAIMPPKAAPKSAGSQSKKSEQKKKEKIIEDKTFGLKNKKGAKQQKFIQQVQHQVKYGGNKSQKQIEKEKEESKVKKDDKKKELAEINALFKPVQQIVSKDADPKSVLCVFFKQGQCSKGNKCKFSHDLNIARKSEKRSAYVDSRNEGTCEDWDEETLKDVVEKKHGMENNKPTTAIICKYFLDSLEVGKYGWFWECPNGDKCIYRHALPPGYVLKKDRKKMEKQEEQISLEDLIERERAALGHDTVRVTLETFLAWKRKKLKEKQERESNEMAKKKDDYRSGKDTWLSGREMFTFNPDLMCDEDMEEGDEDFDVRNMSNNADEEQIEYKEIDYSALLAEYQCDGDEQNGVHLAATNHLQMSNDTPNDVANTEPSNSASGATEVAIEALGETVAINEELFDSDELDDLDDQLDEMTL